MNIFFTASLRGKAENGKYYQNIVDILSNKHKVFAEHILEIDISHVKGWNPEYKFEYYKNILEKIKNTDLLVAEFSYESINISYEVSIASQQKKNIIVLYRGNKTPDLLQKVEIDNSEQKFIIINYTDSNLETQLESALEEVKHNITQRFTILLPPHILHYLDKMVEELNIPRSVFIRNLIETHMENDH